MLYSDIFTEYCKQVQISFGLPMIAAVIAEKTCDTPTCTLVEVFMINETFPVGQLYSRAAYIQRIHLFSLKTPTLIFFLGPKTQV